MTSSKKIKENSAKSTDDLKGYISSLEASNKFSITNDYVARLCRQGKVLGKQIDRVWYVDAKSLASFLGSTKADRESRKGVLSEERRKEYLANQAYISSIDAAAKFGITGDYVSRLCRSGKVSGRRIGKRWYVESDALSAFLITQQHLKEAKRNELAVERAYEYSTIGKLLATKVSSFPTGVLHAAANASAHLPSKANIAAHVLTPATDIFHKLIGITVGISLVVGTYAIVNPQAAVFAIESVRDAVTGVQKGLAGLFNEGPGGTITRARLQLASVLVSTDRTTDVSGEEGTTEGFLARVARSFNSAVNAYMYAHAFPGSFVFGTDSDRGGASVIARISVGPQPSKTTSSAQVATNKSKAPVTVIQNPVIERVVETERLVTVGGITEEILSARIKQLDDSLTSRLISLTNANTTHTTQVYQTLGMVGRAENFEDINIDDSDFTDGRITNSSISGGSISDVDLPADDLIGIVAISKGGTGTSTAPSYGQLLLGQSDGSYVLTSTSSLGIISGVDGSGSANQFTYWTDSDTIAATSSPFFSNFSFSFATGTAATTTNFAITGITSSLLKTNANGSLVAAVAGTDYSNFQYLFPSNATTTLLTFSGGLYSFASTTIGAGTQVTGLTISGGATTTGNQYVGGSLSLGTALSAVNGGTGHSTFVQGDILYASAANTLSRLPIGDPGEVLKIVGGVPTWDTDLSSGGGGTGGTWATTTSQVAGVLINYPNNNSDVVTVGSTATTSAEYWFDPNGGRSFLTGRVGFGTTSPAARITVWGSDYRLFEAVNSASTTIFSIGQSGATTTNFAISNITSSLLKTDSSGSLIAAVLGTDYQNFQYLFPNNATTTGLGLYASTTIGAGGQATGLTINGGATTTGNLYVAGNIGIRDQNPSARLSFGMNTIGTELLNFYEGDGTDDYGLGVQSNEIQFYQPSDGHWSFNSGGSLQSSGTNEILRILGTGNVGIGTTTPSQKLSVQGSAPQAYFYDSNNNRGAFFGVNDGFNAVMDSAGGASIIKANGTSYLTVGSGGNSYFNTGNVGIGTTSPEAALEVWADDSASDYFAAQFMSDRTDGWGGLHVGSTGTGGVEIDFSAANNEGWAQIFTASTGNFDMWDLVNDVSRVTFAQTGNVGIGTTSPYARLSVVGQTVAAYFTATTTTNINTFPLLTATTATTTNLAVTGIASSLLKTNSLGQVTAAVAGTDYANFGYLFPVNGYATTTGLGILASTTIGAGGQTTGLTISGGATTTGLMYVGGTGTSTIASNLEVQGALKVGNSSLYINSNSIHNLTGSLLLQPNGGNVGIGTTTPSAKLSVASSTTAGISDFINLDLLDGASPRIVMGHSASSTRWVTDNDTGVYRLYSSTNNSGSAGTVRMTINGGSGEGYFAGNFGVGSSTPWAKLSVTNTGSGPSLVVEDSTSPDTTPFIVDASGNVGIGTTTPNRGLTLTRTGADATTNYAALEVQTTASSGYGPALILNGASITNGRNWQIISSGSSDGLGLPTGKLGFYDATSVAVRMAIDSSGNVGIGTTSPSVKLEIGDAVNSQLASYVTNSNSGTGAYAEVGARNGYSYASAARLLAMGTGWTTNGAYLQDSGVLEAGPFLSNGLSIAATASGGDVRFYTGGFATSDERMRILSTGNVGIGTTAPFTALTLATSTANTDGEIFTIWQTDTSVSLTQGIGRISFASSDTGSGGSLERAYIYAVNTDGGTTGQTNLAFGTASSAGSAGERMRITNAGLVGIGTDAPGQKLTVETDQASNYIQSTSYGTGLESGFVAYGPRGTQDTPTANQTSDILGTLYFGGFDANISNGAKIYASAAAEWGTAGDSSDAPTDLYFATVPDGSGTMTDRMVITSTGNVGIGTTSPAHKLGIIPAASGEGIYIAGVQQPTIMLHSSSNSVLGAQLKFREQTPAWGFDLIHDTGATTGGDSLRFQALNGGAGTEVLTLNQTSFNVGVGSSTPWGKLTVTNTGTTPSFIVEDSTSPDTSPFIIDASGNVGVGKTVPATALDVVGTASSTGLQVNGNATITGTISAGTANPVPALRARHINGKAAAADTNDTLYINYDAAGVGMVIGDTGTDHPLSVFGTGTFASTITEAGSAVISAADIDTCAELIALAAAYDTGTCGNLVFSVSPSITGTLDAAAADFSSTLTLSGSAANIVLGSNYLSGDGGDEGVFVASTGNVGIGDATPTEATLVVGNGGAGEIFFTPDIPISSDDALCWDGSGASLLMDCINGANADYAEAYPIDGSIASSTSYGYIVMTSDEQVMQTNGESLSRLVRATTQSQHKIIGVLSNNYSDFTSTGHALFTPNDNPIPVALNGRVPVKVSLEGGAIAVGDRISLSSIPGVGKKAQGGEPTVGIALEPYTTITASSTVMTFIDIRYPVEGIFIADSGNIGIGTTTPQYDLHVVGDIAAQSFVNISASSTKKDIREVATTTEATYLEKLEDIELVNYLYISDSASSTPHLGLIAEDAPAEVLAEGGKGVDLYKFISFLTGAMKSLASQVKEIGAKVAALVQSDDAQNKRIQELENRIAELEGNTIAIEEPLTGTGGGTDESPVITIIGDSTIHIAVGDTYTDQGALVSDDIDPNPGIITFVDGEQVNAVILDTTSPRSYEIKYRSVDSAENATEQIRTVIVEEAEEIENMSPSTEFRDEESTENATENNNNQESTEVTETPSDPTV